MALAAIASFSCYPKPPALAGGVFTNKSMDYEDLLSPRAQEIINELNALIKVLKARGVQASSWYGRLEAPHRDGEILNRGYGYTALPGASDDALFPWFLYWEIVWVVSHAQFRPGQKIIDLGGSSSLFSYYLASKGLDVVTVDMNQRLVDNANHTAKVTGWPLTNLCMDIRQFSTDAAFDHITSICVYEHIPMFDRISINSSIKNILKPGGFFSITFDYRNPSQMARISTPEDIYEQFIKPLGMQVRGNKYFYDNSKNYLLHPFFHKDIEPEYKDRAIDSKHFDPSFRHCTKDVNDYTFGALFLENKPDSQV